MARQGAARQDSARQDSARQGRPQQGMARQGMGALRVTAIVGFIVAMPVLALPAVNERLDRWVFGDDDVSMDEMPLDGMPLDSAPIPEDRAAQVAASAGSSASASSTPPSDAERRTDSSGTFHRDHEESAGEPQSSTSLAGFGPSRPRLSLVGPSTPLERLPQVTTDDGLTADGGATPDSFQEPRDPAERMRHLQARLEQLGATYLRLEEVKSERPERLFRFQCQMPVAGGSAYQRPFQVEHVDPLEAMQRVLGEVETWCAARDAPGRRWR